MAGDAPRFFPRRQLGRTGFIATAPGIGDITDRSVPLDECVHSTLSCDPDAALSYAPLPADRMKQIRERAREAVRGKGDCWWNPLIV